MAKAKRYRVRFDFHLNIAKSDENELVQIIANLKSIGLFSKTIRDGIRLICDLRDGNLDVLFELFPWVRAEFLEYMTSVQPQKSDTELVISDQLARIETMLSTNGNGSQPTSGVGGPKAIAIPTIFSTPVYGDDENDVKLVMKKSEKGGQQAAENFLTSAFSLQE